MLVKYKTSLFWNGYVFLLATLISCQQPRKLTSSEFADSLVTSALRNVDTTLYCYRFRKLSTAEDYFQSANTRSKGCMFDSLAQLVALKEYAYAVQLDEKHGYARRNLARQLLYIHQYARALQELNAIDSAFLTNNPDLYTMRGEALYGVHQYKEAVADFNHGLQSGPSAHILLLRAKAEWKLGQHANACETYRSALAMNSLSTSRKEFIDCDTP